jgi:hypothetical protein
MPSSAFPLWRGNTGKGTSNYGTAFHYIPYSGERK